LTSVVVHFPTVCPSLFDQISIGKSQISLMAYLVRFVFIFTNFRQLFCSVSFLYLPYADKPLENRFWH